MILLSNALIDVVIHNEHQTLEAEHMQILLVCCGHKDVMESTASQDSWVKVFQKMKEYLLVSICDQELCVESIMILHNFLTADGLKYAVYEETREIFV